MKLPLPKTAFLLAVTAVASMASPLALAQQSESASSPADLQTLDEGEPPAVTIRKPGDGPDAGNRIEERRDHGQTTEIKVQSESSTYYLKPKEQRGSSLPGDAQSGPPTGAQWKIKEFDWSGKKPPKEGAPPDDSDK